MMNRGIPSPGVGFAAPNDPRLVSSILASASPSLADNYQQRKMIASGLDQLRKTINNGKTNGSGANNNASNANSTASPYQNPKQAQRNKMKQPIATMTPSTPIPNHQAQQLKQQQHLLKRQIQLDKLQLEKRSLPGLVRSSSQTPNMSAASLQIPSWSSNRASMETATEPAPASTLPANSTTPTGSQAISFTSPKKPNDRSSDAGLNKDHDDTIRQTPIGENKNEELMSIEANLQLPNQPNNNNILQTSLSCATQVEATSELPSTIITTTPPLISPTPLSSTSAPTTTSPIETPPFSGHLPTGTTSSGNQPGGSTSHPFMKIKHRPKKKMVNPPSQDQPSPPPPSDSTTEVKNQEEELRPAPAAKVSPIESSNALNSQQPQLETPTELHQLPSPQQQQLNHNSKLQETKVQPDSPAKSKQTTVDSIPIIIGAGISQNGNHHAPNKSDTTGSQREAENSSSAQEGNSFSWDYYLKVLPAEVAPKEAFAQNPEPLKNHFKLGMKLEAKDPRNGNSWCLAHVISTEGLRMGIRFDGSDSMNDFFELVDSENIRPIGMTNEKGEILCPPMAYHGSHSNYPKFVEKILMKSDTIIAPKHCFIPPPEKPKRNMFKTGMKLEAIDRKNPLLICPATIGHVEGTEVKIIFDGWRGSFDYTCPYYSRELFPINWCRDTLHSITSPNGWDQLVKNPETFRFSPSPKKSGKSFTNSTPSRQKERANLKNPYFSKLDLAARRKGPQLKSRPVLSKKVSLSSSSPKNLFQSTPKKDKVVQTRIEETVLPEETSIQQSSATLKEDDPKSTEQLLKDDEADQCIDDLDNEDLLNERKFQCQRTVPYSDWLKSKIDVKATQSDSFINLSDTSFPCVNMSDSTSLASTFSSVSITTSSSGSPIIRERSRRKRIKLDESPERSDGGSHGQPSANASKPLNQWSVADVIQLIKTDDSLVKYSTIFEHQEIDGKAFELLTTDIMINQMDIKIGPALKINDLIEKAKKRVHA